MKNNIMRLVIRGSLDLLLHDNADIIEILETADRSDLVDTINAFECSFTWLKKQFEAEIENA